MSELNTITQDVQTQEMKNSDNSEIITNHVIDGITYRIRARSSETASQSLFQMLDESIAREIAKNA